MAPISDNANGVDDTAPPSGPRGDAPPSDITTPIPESTAEAEPTPEAEPAETEAEAEREPETRTTEGLTQTDLRTLADANAAAADRMDEHPLGREPSEPMGREEEGRGL
jgi:hypothetical protein